VHDLGQFVTLIIYRLGVVKMHGRERRAGRTLVWVFAIFVALWLV